MGRCLRCSTLHRPRSRQPSLTCCLGRAATSCCSASTGVLLALHKGFIMCPVPPVFTPSHLLHAPYDECMAPQYKSWETTHAMRRLVLALKGSKVIGMCMGEGDLACTGD